MKNLQNKELQLLQKENEKKLRDCSIENLKRENAIREGEFDLESYYYEKQAEMEMEERKLREYDSDTDYILSFLHLPF